MMQSCFAEMPTERVSVVVDDIRVNLFSDLDNIDKQVLSPEREGLCASIREEVAAEFKERLALEIHIVEERAETQMKSLSDQINTQNKELEAMRREKQEKDQRMDALQQAFDNAISQTHCMQQQLQKCFAATRRRLLRVAKRPS